MGFFKSPLGKKKKAKNLKEPQAHVTPNPEAKPVQLSPKKKGSIELSLAPPLFSNVNDTDRQLLKNLKGTGAGSIRRLSLSSDGAPVSAETVKKKLHISSGRIVRNTNSLMHRSSQENNERFMAQYGLSPFVGTTNHRKIKSLKCAPLPSVLPLVNDDEKDDSDTLGGGSGKIIGIPSLPFDGSDSSLQYPVVPDTTSCDDTTDIRTAPLSPTGSQASFTDRHASVSSVTASPKQTQTASSFRSATSSRQPAGPSSFRSPKQPQRITSPNSSFRSLSSPKKASSSRSIASADEESYVEEYVLEEEYDEIEYYEEIIEEELDPTMLCDRPAKVKFDEYDEMQLTLNVNDYSDQEMKKSWYRRKDYDEMIREARQVALREEERARHILSSMEAATPDIPEQQSPQVSISLIPQHSDARGLEAWTPTGAVQVRKIKEAAIEAVWDEQHRQWQAGVQDLEAMRHAYRIVSADAQKQAEERGFADQQVVDKIRQLEELSTSDEVKNKRGRASRIFVKGRNIFGKSVKAASKVARETGKRGARASVGAVTLDSRMLLEAIKIEKKKRDAKRSKQEERYTFKQPSLSSIARHAEASVASGSSVSTHGEPKKGSRKNDELSASIHEKGAAIESIIKARADKLKLLGVVPIPGTKKMYTEDRREKKLEKRSSKRCGYATWEASLAAEGKL